MLMCGIDPGTKGAFSFLDTDANTLTVQDMPTTVTSAGKNVVDYVEVGRILRVYKPDKVILEDVHSSPQMGVVSSFTFGRATGILQGACAALEIPVTFVLPQIWKKAMGCTSDKKKTVERATQLMPKCLPLWKLVKHTDRAQASLLALYGAVTSGTKVFDIQPINI